MRTSNRFHALAIASLASLLAACGGSAPPPAATEQVAVAEDVPELQWPRLDDNSPAPLPMDQVGAANYYLVLDGSGSMGARGCSGNTNKIQAAVVALDRFIGTLPVDANLGFASFDDNGIAERVPLALDNREQVRNALRGTIASGGTPLRSAMQIGVDKLTTQAQRQLGYGEYHLVVVTDGQPDPRSEDPTPVVEDLLATSPIVLHTIGFCIGEDHVLNQPGRTFYIAADSPEQLERGLDSVLAEAPSFDVAAFSN